MTKEKLGENLISREEYEELSARFKKENGQEMQPHEVPGFYTRKVRYNVRNINDFIMKLRKTAMCDQFFQQNNLEFCGLKEVFEKLFRITRRELAKNELLGREEEIGQNMVEISNFVMYNLHSEFFYKPE